MITKKKEVIINLKQFHIVFVLASTMLAGFFSWWAYQQYVVNSSTGYMATAIVAALAAVGAIFYGMIFSKKVKI